MGHPGSTCASPATLRAGSPVEVKKEEVLANLSYFMEWGGRSWEKLCRYALHNLGDLQGKTILEVGPRFGKMAVCFALLGARVVGIETSARAVKRAEEEAKRWGVQAQVSVVLYDGDPDHCEALNDSVFDLIFTKSVLVLLGGSLADYLHKLDRRLKPEGSCIFLENRHGGPVFALLRRLLRPRKLPHRITLLRPGHLRLIGQVFHLTEVKKSLIPPIYLIVARKKPAGCSKT